jgi:hypothetical protein
MLSLDGGTKVSEGTTVILCIDGDGELNDSLLILFVQILHLERWHLTIVTLPFCSDGPIFLHYSFSVVSVSCTQLVITTNWLFLLAAL